MFLILLLESQIEVFTRIITRLFNIPSPSEASRRKFGGQTAERIRQEQLLILLGNPLRMKSAAYGGMPGSTMRMTAIFLSWQGSWRQVYPKMYGLLPLLLD
jgi:hypothetical protein